MIHNDVHFDVGGGVGGGSGKKEMLSDVGGWGVRECSGSPVFIFFIKENWICAVTRHHAESNIYIIIALKGFQPSYF